MKTCPQCGASAEDYAKFCTACGASLTAAPAPPPETIRCPACGYEQVSGTLFCGNCGARLSETPASDTPPEPVDDGRDDVTAAPTPPPAPVDSASEEEPADSPQSGISLTKPSDVPDDTQTPEPVPPPEETVNPMPFQHNRTESAVSLKHTVPSTTTAAIPSNSMSAEQTPPAESPTPDAPPDPGSPTPPAGQKKPSNRRILLGVLALAAVICCVLGFRAFSRSQQCRKLLDSAAALVQQESYDDAESAFQQALALDADNEEALLGLAGLYIRQEDFDAAAKTLSALKQPWKEQYQTLYALAKQPPEIDWIETENFPLVTVALSCGSPEQITEDSVAVTENGETCTIQKLESSDDGVQILYETRDVDYASEHREVAVTLRLSDYDFQRAGAYDTPSFQPATVRLVSADMSDYPTVRAYFQVADPYSGSLLEGLTSKSFLIREQLQGGEYLSREVHSVATLEGRRGLNIALVADKSDSIYSSDMQKIKYVMSEFVNALDFAVGDRAEVLAFDSIVQQMCSYTNDPTLLNNGINNMSTDGMTAFYDAVYAGINHAALQGGARCVIAFTDGLDNVSSHSASQVIDYAVSCQVPVYIIGVGYVDASVLESIACNTGGRYWYIDDLYDLSQIFSQIYEEQQKMYEVEYISSNDLDAYDTRNLEVIVTGGGYKAKDQIQFRPVESLSQTKHTSRYELIKESLTWEEAAQRCQEMGGHLATITSQQEEEELIRMAEAQDVRFVWLGGYTSYDDYGTVFAHWVTGEDFTYQHWCAGEPSRVDIDGVPEWYLMLWNIESLGGWTWNDQRNDPASAVPAMAQHMGFICEYEY